MKHLKYSFRYTGVQPPAHRISPSGEEGTSSKTDGGAPTISLDDAWKPTTVSLDNAWKRDQEGQLIVVSHPFSLQPYQMRDSQ